MILARPVHAQITPLCVSGCVGVSVTPDGGNLSVLQNTTNNPAVFTVTNTGLVAATYTLACSRTGNVTCQSVTPSSVSLDPREDWDVTVRFSAGTVGSGLVRLTASGGGTDAGSYNVSVQAVGAPTVTLRNHNRDNVDRSLCLTAGAGEAAAWSCGDLVITHSMPGFSTLGRDRALTLIYNSATAYTRPPIAASVTVPAGIAKPDSVYAELKVGGTVRNSATYGGWPSGSTGTRQIVLDFNAASDPTGAYPIELRVQNRYGAAVYETLVKDTLLIVNRFVDEFGAGFSLAGLEQLYFNQPVGTGLPGILWVGGDGSAKLYRRLSGSTTKWVAPLGSYQDTMSLSSGIYTRTLRHNVKVQFNSAGRHIATLNRVGQKTTFTWNAAGDRLISIRVPPGGVTGTTYNLYWDTNGNLDSIVDPGGRKLDATFNFNDGRLSKLTDPDGKFVSFGWDGDRRIISRLSRRGFTTTYEYSAGHAYGSRVTKVTVPVGRVVGDNSTAVTTFDSWNDKGLAAASSGQTAVAIAQAYTKIYGPRYPGVADTAAFTVDRWGAPTKIVNAVGNTTTLSRGDPAHPALVTRMVYNNGRIDTLWYNARGNLVEVRDSTWHLASAIRLPTSAAHYSYPAGIAADSPDTVRDALAHTTKYAYNSQGLTDSIVDPRGHRTKFFYKPATDSLRGQLDSIVERQVLVYRQSTATTVTVSPTQRFGYEIKGNLKASTSPVGLVTSYVRDAFGRVTDVYDPLNTRKNLTYDPLNRLTQSVQYTTKQANPVVTNPLAGCDATQVSCADSIPATYVPSLPATLTTLYGYGAVELDTVIDPRSVKRTYRHDARGLQWQQQDEFSKTDSASYDVSGLLSLTVSRDTDIVRFHYDTAGRRTSMVYGLKDYSAGCRPNPACVTTLQVPGDSVTYTYDVEDHLLTATNQRGTITRSYYADGSLKQKINQLTGLTPDTLMYEYDAARAVTRVIHGRDVRDTTTYRYNTANGGLDTLDFDGAGLNNTYRFRFTYDGLGRRQQVTYPNGTVVTLNYDAAGLLRQVTSNHPGSPPTGGDILDFTLRKLRANPAGFVTADSMGCASGISYGPPCGPSGMQKDSNAYNRLGMLVRQRANAAVDSMGYDASGNLLFRLDGVTGGRHSFSMIAASNQLAGDTLAAMNYEYRSDGARDVEYSSRNAYSTRFYYYDGLGRMSGTWGYVGTLNYNNAQACLYDADGQTSKPCDNGASRLAYDGHNVIATPIAGSNGPTWRFVHGPGLDDPLLGWYRQGNGAQKVYYWVTDGQGRHLAFSDSTGTLGSDDYNNYYLQQGGTFAGGTSSAETFRADRFSSATVPGLSLFRNRAYDQNTGRWTQEDPIGVAGGLNLYQFNGNNPVMYTDPFGLCVGPLVLACPAIVEAAMWALGAVIGVAAIEDISNKVGEGSTGGPTAGRRATPKERQDALDAARGPDGVVQCSYCGKDLTPEPGTPNSETIDHVKPRNPKPGRPQGNNEPENLKPACPGCNSGKGNREYPTEWRPRTEP